MLKLKLFSDPTALRRTTCRMPTTEINYAIPRASSDLFPSSLPRRRGGAKTSKSDCPTASFSLGHKRPRSASRRAPTEERYPACHRAGKSASPWGGGEETRRSAKERLYRLDKVIARRSRRMSDHRVAAVLTHSATGRSTPYYWGLVCSHGSVKLNVRT